MTFEEWAETHWMFICNKEDAKIIWDAAQTQYKSIGFIVYNPKDIEHAATYNLDQKDFAYDCSQRWGDPIAKLFWEPPQADK